ncbi:MAG: hypothetical protein WEC59_05450 [Salibacteraceae bacterium]
MLIGDELIYLELHKTGCTHTRNILSKIDSLNAKPYGKHNKYHELPKKHRKNFDDKIKLGNIRNPWDWYVSLWAFGCLKKGGLYNRVTESPNIIPLKKARRFMKHPYMLYNNPKAWRKVYADANDSKLFRIWLKLILNDSDVYLGENYKKLPLSEFTGLLSFRYLNLYTYRNKNAFSKIKSPKQLKSYNEENNFIDIIIPNEKIHTKLVDVAPIIGASKKAVETVLSSSEQRTNASKREDYRHYYDEETMNLVKKKDQLIIDKFGYTFETPH